MPFLSRGRPSNSDLEQIAKAHCFPAWVFLLDKQLAEQGFGEAFEGIVLAVEQVNLAIANVAQASRETEASSAQTLQTASQLATLSRDLNRVVQPEAA